MADAEDLKSKLRSAANARKTCTGARAFWMLMSRGHLLTSLKMRKRFGSHEHLLFLGRSTLCRRSAGHCINPDCKNLRG